jgi:hypothetical protein
MMVMMVMMFWGCLGNVTGDWAGLCTIPTASYAADMDVFLSVFTDNGYEIEGEMTIADWTGATRTSSQFSGSRTGQFAELQGRFLSELGSYELLLDVERDPGRLTGDCTFIVPEGEGALLGDVELSR